MNLAMVAIRQYTVDWKNAASLPWQCCFCGEQIESDAPKRSARSLVVHHINEDRTDHRLKNLAGAHRTCHSSHHMSGRTLTATHKVRVGAARSRAWTTEARKAQAQRASEQFAGKQWTAARRKAQQRRKDG